MQMGDTSRTLHKPDIWWLGWCVKAFKEKTVLIKKKKKKYIEKKAKWMAPHQHYDNWAFHVFVLDTTGYLKLSIFIKDPNQKHRNK